MTRALLIGAAVLLVLPGAAAAAPILSLPSDVTAEAEGPGGAVVAYTASAANPAGKALEVSCVPSSGSTFPLGSTTVTCTVVDTDDGSSASGTFPVTVVDTTAPAVTGMPSVTVDAAGPTGAVASYALPTAEDLVDGTVAVQCTPSSGSIFPVGTTSVTCTATDSRGNTATANGSVAVVDNVPPTLTPPTPLTVGATSPAGVGAADPRVAAFLAAVAASDTVTPAPQVTNDASGVFPVGTTTVRFSATDASGNTASATSTVTVTPPPPDAPAPAAPTPTGPAPQTPVIVAGPGGADRTPPGEVTGVRARRAGSGAVSITWQLPTDADLANVSIFRSIAADTASTSAAVYVGTSTSFQDTKLRNGVLYRYVIVAVDRAGNRSRGVAFAIQPRANLLWAPVDGARIVARPLFVWAPRTGAAYYNVQVFRGTRKVFSAWPAGTRLRMPASWRFGGERQRLVPGTYRWYVWPGFGARANARFGEVLGTSTFTVVAR